MGLALEFHVNRAMAIRYFLKPLVSARQAMILIPVRLRRGGGGVGGKLATQNSPWHYYIVIASVPWSYSEPFDVVWNILDSVHAAGHGELPRCAGSTPHLNAHRPCCEGRGCRSVDCRKESPLGI